MLRCIYGFVAGCADRVDFRGVGVGVRYGRTFSLPKQDEKKRATDGARDNYERSAQPREGRFCFFTEGHTPTVAGSTLFVYVCSFFAAFEQSL